MVRRNIKTTNKNTKRIDRRLIIALVLLFIIVATAVVAGLYFLMPQKANQIESSEPEVQGTINAENTAGAKDTSGEKTPVQNDGVNPNTLDALTGSITYAAVSNNYLRIRVNIDQFTAGICELRLISGNTVVHTEIVEILDSASTSTCAGFDVPARSLGTGNYSIEVDIRSDNKSGLITSEVSI